MLHAFSLFICLLFPVFGVVLTPPLLDLESKGGITTNHSFLFLQADQFNSIGRRLRGCCAAAPSVVSPLYIAFIYILTHPLALI